MVKDVAATQLIKNQQTFLKHKLTFFYALSDKRVLVMKLQKNQIFLKMIIIGSTCINKIMYGMLITPTLTGLIASVADVTNEIV